MDEDKSAGGVSGGAAAGVSGGAAAAARLRAGLRNPELNTLGLNTLGLGSLGKLKHSSSVNFPHSLQVDPLSHALLSPPHALLSPPSLAHAAPLPRVPRLGLPPCPRLSPSLFRRQFRILLECLYRFTRLCLPPYSPLTLPLTPPLPPPLLPPFGSQPFLLLLLAPRPPLFLLHLPLPPPFPARFIEKISPSLLPVRLTMQFFPTYSLPLFLLLFFRLPLSQRQFFPESININGIQIATCHRRDSNPELPRETVL
ncbi:unnamed protein product [Closterium sp. NIES-53]